MPNGTPQQPIGADGQRIGERLRALRVAASMSQRDLAAGSRSVGRGHPSRGVTAAYISRIEKGDRHPSVYVIRALADALQVSAALLETGEGSTNADG